MSHELAGLGNYVRYDVEYIGLAPNGIVQEWLVDSSHFVESDADERVDELVYSGYLSKSVRVKEVPLTVALPGDRSSTDDSTTYEVRLTRWEIDFLKQYVRYDLEVTEEAPADYFCRVNALLTNLSSV